MKKTVLTVLLAILSIAFCEAQAQIQDALKQKQQQEAQQQKAAKEQREREQNQIKQELERRYQNLITSAERNFNQKQYEQAKQDYREARTLKPENASYINQKISEIDMMIRDEAEVLERLYQNTITSANRSFDDRQYEQAKQDYIKALELKPENATFINAKIAEIDEKLLEIEKRRAEAELERQYQNVIESAKRNFNQQKYAQARKDYQKALDLKPENAYSINPKIAEIDKILLEKERRDKMLFAKGKKVSYLYKDEQVLSKSEVQNLMSKYPEALRLYNKGLKNNKTGNTLMTIGILGGGVGACFIFVGKGNEKTIGVVTTVIGGGIFIIGGITRLSGNSAIRKSVNEYNNRLYDKYSSANVELKFNISCNSIGLTLDF